MGNSQNIFSPQGSKKHPPQLKNTNFIESLKSIGQGAGQNMREAIPSPEDFFREMLGVSKPPVKLSGELQPGQAVELEKAYQEEREENKLLRARLRQEQGLRSQEQKTTSQGEQKIKLELHAIISETQKLARGTQKLSQELKIATVQMPVNPGKYHILFFERLRSTIASFRKKIEDAGVWLGAINQKSRRQKTFWGQVKQSGSKRLLSSEDYSQRSQG